MKELERKKNSQPFFCKRLFKLVFVLFKLKKGLNVDEIWRQLQTQIDTEEMLGGDGSQGNSSFAKDGMSFNSKQYDVKALAP